MLKVTVQSATMRAVGKKGSHVQCVYVHFFDRDGNPKPPVEVDVFVDQPYAVGTYMLAPTSLYPLYDRHGAKVACSPKLAALK